MPELLTRPPTGDARPAACTDPACPRFLRIRTARIATSGGQYWESHQHPDLHELLWGARGTVRVESGGEAYFLPPDAGLLLPAGRDHAVTATARSGFNCTFIDASLGRAPAHAFVDVPPLLRELLWHLEEVPEDLGIRRNAEGLAFSLLRPQDDTPPRITLPLDDRLRAVAQGILDDPAGDCTLEDWGLRVGASPRNLSRLFLRDTGMTFAQWRLCARFSIAASLLSQGLPVARVARQVGYQSASAFVAAFRKEHGTTPGALQEALGG